MQIEIVSGAKQRIVLLGVFLAIQMLRPLQGNADYLLIFSPLKLRMKPICLRSHCAGSCTNTVVTVPTPRVNSRRHDKTGGWDQEPFLEWARKNNKNKQVLHYILALGQEAWKATHINISRTYMKLEF